MLLAKPAPGNLKTMVGLEARADLFAGAEKIGALLYELKGERATIDLRGETFYATRERPRAAGEFILAPLIRALRGQTLPPNPFVLTNASGDRLAFALNERKGVVIDAGGERFEFGRNPAVPHGNALTRDGGALLGSVRKESRLSPGLAADLPSEVPEWLQAFLFAIMYDGSLVSMAQVGGSN
jgi:hypothetical protein